MTPGHPHPKLYRQLVDSSSIRADGGSTSRCRSRPYERVGVKTKRKEKCAFSITEDHLSGRGVGFDHDAGTAVSCSDRVDRHCSQRRLSSSFRDCCIQCDTFWPAVHETPIVVAQDQGVFPEGKSASHDQGHAAMLSCLSHYGINLGSCHRGRCWEFLVIV